MRILRIFLLTLFLLLSSSVGIAAQSPSPKTGLKGTAGVGSSSPSPSPTPTNVVNPQGSCSQGHVDTALGCIPTDPQSFVQSFFKWALPFAGLASFLMIVFGAFGWITAGGDPEKIKKAQESITSAIVGLVVVIFSLVILQIIGVDILGLPGLTVP